MINDGYVLHRVVWQSNYLFSSLQKKYVDHVNKQFNESVTINFYVYRKATAAKVQNQGTLSDEHRNTRNRSCYVSY